MNCGTQDENVPGSGTWRVATQGSSAPGDLVALLGAYALPSGNNVGRSCTGELDFDPYVVLIDGKGDAIWPAAPRDGCGRVRAEVTAAIAATHWTVTESKRAVLEAPASTPPAGSVKP